MAAKPVRRVGPPQVLVEAMITGPNGLHEVQAIDLRMGSLGDVSIHPDGVDLTGGSTDTGGGGGGGTDTGGGGGTASPAGSVVQVASATLANGTRSGTVTLQSVPAVGNLVFTAIVTDKDPVSLTVDPDFTALPLPLPHIATSVGGHAAWRVANGTEADRAATWAFGAAAPPASHGARIVIVELGSGGGTFAHAATALDATETTRTTATVDPGASTTALELAVAFAGIDTSDNGQWDPAKGDPVWGGGYTTAITAYGDTGVKGSSTYNGGAGVSVATKTLAAAATAAAASVSWSQADQVFVAASRFTVTGGTAPTVTVQYGMQGARGTDRVTISAKLKGSATSNLVRLNVAGVLSPAVNPSAAGWAKMTVTGLAAGTAYTAVVEVDGVADKNFTFPFRTQAVSPSRVRIGFASCDNSANNTDAYARMLTRGVDVVSHTGDWDYANITVNDQAAIRSAREGRFANAGMKALLRQKPIRYGWDDHDFGGNDSDRNTASKPAVQAVYREMMPTPALPSATGGAYFTDTEGDLLRFIVLDVRSYRSPSADPDSSSKTMLGAEQMTWLRDTVTAAKEAVIVIQSAVGWIGSGGTGVDHWGAYGTERAGLASFLAATGKRIAFLVGDQHAVAADDGTNSPGGIPVFHGAPWERTASIKGGPYSVPPFPESGNAIVRQYGILDITRDAREVTAAFTGYATDDTAVRALTKAWPADAAPPIAQLPLAPRPLPSIGDDISWLPDEVDLIAAKLDEVSGKLALPPLLLPDRAVGTPDPNDDINLLVERADVVAGRLRVAPLNIPTRLSEDDGMLLFSDIAALIRQMRVLVDAANGIAGRAKAAVFGRARGRRVVRGGGAATSRVTART